MYVIDHEILKIEVNPFSASYPEMVAMAREYMEFDGLDPLGLGNYRYYLSEVARRNRNYGNPANQALTKASEPLLDYLANKS